MQHSIKFKLILGVLILSFVLQIISSFFQYFQIQDILTTGIKTSAVDLITGVVVDLNKSLADEETLEDQKEFLAIKIAIMEDELRNYVSATEKLLSIQYFDVTGKILAFTDPIDQAPSEGQETSSEPDKSGLDRLIEDFFEKNLLDISLFAGKFYVFIPHTFQDNPLGGFLLAYSSESLTKELNRLLMITLALVIFYMLFSAFGAWLVAKRIITPIQQVSKAMEDLVEGEGDLTKKLPVKSKDELGNLVNYFNLFIHNIGSIVKGINQSANHLSQFCEKLGEMVDQNTKTILLASEAIQNESDDIAGSASTIQEMAATVEATSDQIKALESIARAAEQKATEGKNAVIATNESMKRIDDGSKQIDGIISVITDIANQTNLLSLNAAIEAAKAGDMGKGFAVVADEVRRLAERSSTSVVEIRQLIDESRTNVINGNRVIEKTGKVLAEIIEQVNHMSVQINFTSKSIVEQDVGIQEIAKTADSMSDTSEKNASSLHQLSTTAKEIAQTTQALNDLSNDLRGQVSRFKTAENSI